MKRTPLPSHTWGNPLPNGDRECQTDGSEPEWHYDTPEGLPKEDRDLLREKGWTVEPLVVPDDHRQRAFDLLSA